MPIVEYPFTTLSPGAPPRPMLPIRIHNPDTGLIYRTWGLIDTGADRHDSKYRGRVTINRQIQAC